MNMKPSIYGYQKSDDTLHLVNGESIITALAQTPQPFDGYRYSVIDHNQSPTCSYSHAVHSDGESNYVAMRVNANKFDDLKAHIVDMLSYYPSFEVGVYVANELIKHQRPYCWLVVNVDAGQMHRLADYQKASVAVAQALEMGKFAPSLVTDAPIPVPDAAQPSFFNYGKLNHPSNSIFENEADDQIPPFTIPLDQFRRLVMANSPKESSSGNHDKDDLPDRDSDCKSVAEVLRRHLNGDFEPDPKLSNQITGDLIANIFPPAVVAGVNDDADGLVIFDPTKGCWIHDENAINGLIRYVKPYASDMDARNIIKQFAYTAGHANEMNIIEPYSGSRYLLFRNGCYDTQTDKLYPLDDPLVPKLNFTLRHRLEIDFVRNPKLPTFEHGRIDIDSNPDSKPWNPKDFIHGYGNNDPAIIQYFLFGLALGLFGGHNFGVHFDIQGSSRWGKTTLQKIYANLYGNRVITIPFSALNERFAFTNYQLDTANIWVKECNTGASELNGDGGTDIYDALADSNVNIQVKGKNDLIVQNPPQVYIDGTQLIQAKELGTGPAGRTMPYELPTMTHELQIQTYSNDIAGMLSNKSVLQWLVWQMIQAYNAVMPKAHDNIVINLTRNDWKRRLPDVYETWSKDLVTDHSDISDFWENNIEPYLTDTSDENDPNATLMHDQELYSIWYESFYTINNPFDPYHNRMLGKQSFVKRIDKIIEQHGWRKTDAGNGSGRGKSRKMVKNVDRTHFDTDQYIADFTKLPDRLDDSTGKTPAPFGARVRGWYKLIRIPNPNA